MSAQFLVGSGVRQGSCLSPAILMCLWMFLLFS